MTLQPQQPNFNPIARPYKALEYLTLGPTLQRCRTHHLPALLQQKSALVLGDGDGRFLARLLAANPAIHVDAVDTSRTMLDLLEARCKPYAVRLHTHHTTARAFADSLPPTRHYDLIVTHFFLDCLTQPALDTLIQTLAPHLAPTATSPALWLLSDFRIPPQGPTRLLARALVRTLYLAFRLLTNLRTTHLPDHATPLTAAGLTLTTPHHPLTGILTTELWCRPSESAI